MLKMKTLKKIACFAMAAAMTMTSIWVATPQVKADSSVTINWNDVKQRIDGFGSSLAWSDVKMQDLISKATHDEILDKLYNPSTGIGQQIYRVRIAPDCSPSQGVYDWTHLDKMAVSMKRAKLNNPDVIFYALPWSPPYWMKDNNDQVGGKLKLDCYDDYTQYLADYLNRLKDVHGINVSIFSLQNEPMNTPDWESCELTDAQLNSLLKNNIAPTFSAQGLSSVKFMLNDKEHWKADGWDTLAADSAAFSLVDYASAHFYGGSTLVPVPTIKNAGKKLWMSEHYLYGNGTSISSTLNVAKEMHDFLTIAEVNAYLYWWGSVVDTNNSATSQLISYNSTSDTYKINSPYYAVGHFSKYIDSGYDRIGLSNHNPETDVYVSAYKKATNGNFTVVVINKNTAAKNITFNLNGFEASSVTPYRTTSTEKMVQLSDIMAGSSFAVSLPASSIVTLTGTANSAPLIDWSFNGSTTGAAPSSWTTTTTGGTVTVVEVPSASDKSAKLNDNSGSADVSMEKGFTSQSGAVTIEYDMMLPAKVDYFGANVMSGTTKAITVATAKNGYLTYRTSSGSYVTLQAYNANKWYKIKIVGDVSTDKCDIYVDGVKKATQVAFKSAVSSVDKVQFETSGPNTGTMYIDNVKVIKN